MDCIAYFPKLGIDVPVRKAKHLDSILLQDGGAFLVIGKSLLGVVLGAVKFNHQFGGMAVKIHNKPADCFLTLETDGIMTQEVIPEMVFLFGCVFSQFFCPGNQIALIWQGQGGSLPGEMLLLPPALRATSLREGGYRPLASSPWHSLHGPLSEGAVSAADWGSSWSEKY